MRNAGMLFSLEIIHAYPPELFIIEIGRAISKTIRTKRAFFLPVDHTLRNPKRSWRCQDELDTRVEPCARLVGSINRVVRYISHPAVRSARIPTLYLRGVVPPRHATSSAERQGGGRSTLDAAAISANLGSPRFRKLSVSHGSRQHVPRASERQRQHAIPSGLEWILIFMVDRRVRSPKIIYTTAGAKCINERSRSEIRIADCGCRMIDQFFWSRRKTRFPANWQIFVPEIYTVIITQFYQCKVNLISI